MSTPVIQIPDVTRQRLTSFRDRVRRIKLAEGILAGLFGLAVSLLTVFVLDRFVDTPAAVRSLILLTGSLGFGLFFPLKCHRWLWGTRRMEQVAILLKQKYPALGDQLLGVVELSRQGVAEGSSLTLAQAAVRHVDDQVRQKDFADAVPRPKHRRWAVIAAVPLCLMLLALAVVPAAGWNAVQRWLRPWADIERYTFAQLNQLPDHMVVPHGEEFPFAAQLSAASPWTPNQGFVAFNDQAPVAAQLQNSEYRFQVPPQTDSGQLNVRVGDLRKSLSVQVATRPELNALTAEIALPDYLQYSHPLTTDAVSGAISVVRGSRANLKAEISRPLHSATVQGAAVPVSSATIAALPMEIQDTQVVEIEWRDELGLTSKEAFRLKIKAADDRLPAVGFQQVDPQQVVLTTDVISFDIQADDDFGLKEIGLEWKGIQDPLKNPNPETGEKIVSGGAPEQKEFSGQTTFCAVSDQVRAQSLELRVWAKDYHPERDRAYSPPYVLHVLTPEDHAVWITNQLRRWASLADDVYEEEMRLHDANRELRRMEAAELNLPGNRRRMEQQAAAEQANGQRLGAVTDHGEKLIQQALRNQEMLVGHLETWADALEALKDIGDNRMPSVADLLKSAAQAPGRAAADPAVANADSPPSKTASQVGNDRSQKPAGAKLKARENEASDPADSAPKIVDVESGFIKNEEPSDEEPQDPPPAGGSKLSLPTTVLNGGPAPKAGSQDQPPQEAQQQVDEATEEQADLLAEFAKVRDELQKIMDDLENSTFVKRLKSASRRQMEVATDLNRTLDKGFGLAAAGRDDRSNQQSEGIAAQEEAQSQSVWLIQSDLEAYYDRRKSPDFLKILTEMKDEQVTTRLAEISDRVRKNLSGEAIVRAEFWSDTLDRWAEQLVEPAPGGT
ncbi:MAG: hypothetical protein R3C49_00175 [Planctomycetaceae bacterium]